MKIFHTHLFAALVLLLCSAHASAQYNTSYVSDRPSFYKANKADATFTIYDFWINHRHTAQLGQGNTMIIELMNHADYAFIADLEGILRDMIGSFPEMKDTIAACPHCNYRLDYLRNTGINSYRIRRYHPQGTFLYEKRGSSELRPFKPESDTVHLLIVDNKPPSGYNTYPNRAQVTFILNRYANLDSLLATRGRLNSIVDTFRKISEPTGKWRKRAAYYYRSTITQYRYRRDSAKQYQFYRGLNTNGEFHFPKKAFDIQANIGAGFLRNQIAPMMEGGLVYRMPFTRALTSSFILGVYLSAYYGFVRDAEGKYQLQPNLFLNAEYGDEGRDDDLLGLRTTRLTLGGGILVSDKGDYFTGTTFKLFMNIKLKNAVTLSPEIISTDNLKQWFPGITVKVF